MPPVQALPQRHFYPRVMTACATAHVFALCIVSLTTRRTPDLTVRTFLSTAVAVFDKTLTMQWISRKVGNSRAQGAAVRAPDGRAAMTFAYACSRVAVPPAAPQVARRVVSTALQSTRKARTRILACCANSFAPISWSDDELKATLAYISARALSDTNLSAYPFKCVTNQLFRIPIALSALHM
jgi:hypothetical protein